MNLCTGYVLRRNLATRISYGWSRRTWMVPTIPGTRYSIQVPVHANTSIINSQGEIEASSWTDHILIFSLQLCMHAESRVILGSARALIQRGPRRIWFCFGY